MDAPKKILVGTDFSDISDEALRTASLYARMFGSEVVVAHVFDPTPNVPPMVWSRPDALDHAVRAEIQQAIRETLDGQTSKLLADVKAVELCVCQHPSPGRALCQIAEDERADLLILGSHGRTGLSRAFLGSVAEKVVRHAHCPVLVVREREPQEEND